MIVNPRFYYSVSQFGAEKAVKAEVLSAFSDLKFAFSRPGFMTFKEPDDQQDPIIEVPSVFNRLWGLSVGQAKDMDTLMSLLSGVPKNSILHYFERDQFVPGDEPKDFIFNQNIQKVIASLPKSVLSNLQLNEKPKVGDVVYDLIWLDDFHLFLGKHKHSEKLDQSPGNHPLIILPADSPSRAYLKIAEAIHRFQPSHRVGMQTLEVGCSPGGATLAMLNLGLQVTGIDPKFMAKPIQEHKNFKFIQKTARSVLPDDLLEVNPEWIVLDMNVAPLEALDELGHVLKCLRKNHGSQLKLCCGLLTIKLNDWKFAESIPLYLKRLEDWGFRDLLPLQLCSNRQEFFVLAKDFK
jgi:23S rRNA (cytidine2498-2'-O)-methyltransferase